MSRSAIGANDRIGFAIIGAGTRGSYMGSVFTDFEDVNLLAVCDVYKPTRDAQAAKLGDKVKGKPDSINDYRKLLDRKDVDALLVTTPDHWHGPIVIEASQAGKDCYVEKPLSNTIEMGQKMRAAVRQYKRVVQVGLQQRSWLHFQENAKRVQDGMIGNVYAVECAYTGNYTRDPGPPTTPPADLDWELFQGNAPRRPYVQMRQRSWRAFYDYSGGTLLDWGTHLTDVSQWYMNVTEPLTCSGSGQYVRSTPQPEMLPDTLAVTWQYPKFVMTYKNWVESNPDWDMQGNHFIGTGGWLHVNRTEYRYRPGGGGRGGPAPARAGTVAAPGAPAPAPAAAVGGPGAAAPAGRGRGGAGGRGGVPATPPFEPVTQRFRYEGGPSDHAHARNFLDCVKSRQDPVVSIDTGFFSTLPTLMAVLSVRYGKTYAWDGKQAKAV
jgi:predicted dehydrogenase